jgi:calcineurin-like phosphoesterase
MCPRADEQILPRGTAYISDVGMCGDFNSVLGMDKEEPLNALPHQDPHGRFALRSAKQPCAASLSTSTMRPA